MGYLVWFLGPFNSYSDPDYGSLAFCVVLVISTMALAGMKVASWLALHEEEETIASEPGLTPEKASLLLDRIGGVGDGDISRPT